MGHISQIKKNFIPVDLYDSYDQYDLYDLLDLIKPSL